MSIETPPVPDLIRDLYRHRQGRVVQAEAPDHVRGAALAGGKL